MSSKPTFIVSFMCDLTDLEHKIFHVCLNFFKKMLIVAELRISAKKLITTLI